MHAAACLADAPDVVDAEAAVAGCTPSQLVDRSVGGAKLLADEAAVGNARTAIQVHGGMGFTWEVPLHLHLKRARVHSTTFGTPAAPRLHWPPMPGRPLREDRSPPMTDPALIPADVMRAVPEGEVVYGMQLPIQSQSTLYVADWEKASGPTELARIARVADEAGFFYLGVCDHTAIPADWPTPWGPSGTTRPPPSAGSPP